jgi:hypothetical protein
VAPLSEDELRRLGLSETEIREAKASSEKSLRSMSWPPVRD